MGNSGDQLPKLRAVPCLVLAAAFFVSASPVMAADCPTGRFFAHAGPDTASALEISPDGKFIYILSEGAVDEAAEGIWKCTNSTLLLTTKPTPRAPEFKLDNIEDGVEAPFSLKITWPDGSGIPAVDFQLDFAEGESVTGYTQNDGWSRDLDGRKPIAIRVSEPFFGTTSPRIPLPDRDHIRVTIILTPNDMGIADFRDVPVTREGDAILLHWRGRAIPYRPAADD